jgi:hypothetical protein
VRCEAWNNAATKAGLTDFQIRDLRHEAGSRFDEAGMPINYVSNMLGHSNLSTTSRYLNINRRGLHLAMEKFEENRLSGAAVKPNQNPLHNRCTRPTNPRKPLCNAPPPNPPSNSDFRCDILGFRAFGSPHLRKWRNGRRASLRS